MSAVQGLVEAYESGLLTLEEFEDTLHRLLESKKEPTHANDTLKLQYHDALSLLRFAVGYADVRDWVNSAVFFRLFKGSLERRTTYLKKQPKESSPR